VKTSGSNQFVTMVGYITEDKYQSVFCEYILNH